MELNGKKVLVVGLARSGLAAIKLLNKYGAVITLSETKAADELKEKDYLLSLGVTIEKQRDDVFERDYDLCVKNPGVPFNGPLIRKLTDRGIPVITEIELAFQLAAPQHYIAITGTNGKTTTSTLTYDIFNAAFPGKAHLCGNIGIPLCEIILENGLLEEEGHYIVLEISNFQLVNIDKFRPDCAVILNLTPDHIDFMGGLDAYYKSKTEVYRNMRDDDIFILNVDDPEIKKYTGLYPVKCAVTTMSVEGSAADAAPENGFITYKGENVMPLSEIKIVGRHNLQNILAAVCAAKSAGIESETIRSAVAAFTGVEHRIEFVRELDGVRYYNDSKGTNTDATVTALKAFDKGVILLIGGFEKGLPMDDVKKHLGCVKKIIGFGACGPRLVKDLDFENSEVVTTLDEAMQIAKREAVSGDTVLLSPTTSSFDQYSCFEERGEHFKKIVMEF